MISKFDTIKMEEESPLLQSTVKVIKDRQKEYDQKIRKQLKDARIYFYVEYNKQLYSNKIHYKSLQTIEEQFLQKERECFPIMKILKQQITSLQIIHIQYGLIIRKQGNFWNRYSVSAFTFFKIIHQNSKLKEATLKGVQIENFQPFLTLLNQQASNKLISKQGWMGKFNPSKLLKLSINAKLQFSLSRHQENLALINDLIFFREKFDELSDLIADVRFDAWSQQPHFFSKLWLSLKKIKKISIGIIQPGNFYVTFNGLVGFIRSSLLGQLCSFTQIHSLTLKGIIFQSEMGLNDYFAMEESFATIFENNNIKHLKIHSCQKIPLLPSMDTLQTIDLQWVSFRKENYWISQLLSNSYQLRSIRVFRMRQLCWINGQLSSQLSTLIVDYSLYDFSQGPLSNIKHLSITCWVRNMHNILPKLFNLTFLEIISTKIFLQELLSIPSHSLEELHTWENHKVTNKWLEQVDQKWPLLRNLTLKDCSNVIHNTWTLCKFPRLTGLKVKEKKLGEARNLEYLTSKGVKVNLVKSY